MKFCHTHQRDLHTATHTHTTMYLYTHGLSQSVGNLTARSLYFCAVAAASSSSSSLFASFVEENQ